MSLRQASSCERRALRDSQNCSVILAGISSVREAWPSPKLHVHPRNMEFPFDKFRFGLASFHFARHALRVRERKGDETGGRNNAAVRVQRRRKLDHSDLRSWKNGSASLVANLAMPPRLRFPMIEEKYM